AMLGFSVSGTDIRYDVPLEQVDLHIVPATGYYTYTELPFFFLSRRASVRPRRRPGPAAGSRWRSMPRVARAARVAHVFSMEMDHTPGLPGT
ncbi:hypothetical protein ABT404_47845, partial [Streptomyces hyaluromycini]